MSAVVTRPPGDEHPVQAGQVRISAAAEVARPVLRRIVGAVGAVADLPIDRIDDAQTIVDTLISGADGQRTDATVSARPDGLELAIGPLVPGGAAALIARTAVPQVGQVLERLADRVWTADGERGEYLLLHVGRSAT